MRISRTSGAIAATCLVGAILIVTVAAQDDSAARLFPVVVSDVSASAIDRGIREFDAPRAPRTQRTARFADGTFASAPFLRGSIIVKFRPGTAGTAQRAMLARINGSATRTLSYASFDIVSI